MPTDESMVDRSPLIVFGEVRSAGPGERRGRPATNYFLDVEEVLKGAVGGAIDGSFWVYASGLTDLPIRMQVWPSGGRSSTEFPIPDGAVLRPNNGGRLYWC